MIRDAFLWCAILNFGVSAVWSLLLVLSRESLHRLWSKRVRLPVEQFDAINFAGIALYKIGIILFNLTPYLTLCIVG